MNQAISRTMNWSVKTSLFFANPDLFLKSADYPNPLRQFPPIYCFSVAPRPIHPRKAGFFSELP